MRRQFRGEGLRPRCRPRVEGLETRELLSHVVPAAAHRATSSLPNPAVIEQAVQLLYGPNSQTPMTPSPTEVHRQVFTARWIGQYTVGPPRFSDRADTIHAYGVSGGSNQFLKGKFQISLFPPANPNATPTPGNPYANQVTGVAGLIPENILQSSSVLALDLNGSSSSGAGPLDFSDPSHVDLRLQHERGGIRRAGGLRSGNRNARSQMDAGRTPAPRHIGFRQSDRHVPGPDQYESTRQSGLQVDFLGRPTERTVGNAQIKNATPPANPRAAAPRHGKHKMRGSYLPMRPQSPFKRAARRCRPGLEGLEGRDLPSSHPLGPALPGEHYPAPDVQQFVPILYPPGTPQPTAAEVSRESFIAKGYGRYTIGPGRFDTQALSIHGYGKPMTSNISSKFRFQYQITEPVDKANAVTGVMSLVGGNFLQNSALQILDFVGPTGTEVDGLPTQLYWIPDANQTQSTAFAGTGTTLPGFSNFPTNYFTASGALAPPPGSPGSLGPPTSVDNWNMGIGIVTFKYVPDRHPVRGSLGSGTVILELHGLLNYSGAQSQNDQQYN